MVLRLILIMHLMILLINEEYSNCFTKNMLGKYYLIQNINYTDMKNKYPIQVIDLRFQVQHTNPKKLHFFQE